jgi:glutathione S-transferase
MEQPKPILYYAPHTRAQMSLCMLEELGVDYDLHMMSVFDGDQNQEKFSRLNRMRKVPVLKHGNATISETGAILTYLADAYPQAKLAPAPEATPERAAYLRWLFFGGNCIEPAVMDTFFPRKEPLNPGQAGWGDFTRVLDTLREGLTDRDYLLGDNFSAADVLIGSQVGFSIEFKSIDPKQEPVLTAYATRCEARPAWKRAREIEAEHPNPFN